MELPQPLNTLEHYLYALNKKLDIVIEQNNAMVDYMSKQNNVAIEEVEEVVEVKPVTKTRKKGV